MKNLSAIFALIFVISSCVPYQTGHNDGASDIVIYPNTNMTLDADSVSLELLPLKDNYETLYRGQQVVVAEVNIYPEEGADSIQLKLVHNEKVQGWIPQRQVIAKFHSTDSISQILNWLHKIPQCYVIIPFALFLLAGIVRYFTGKPVRKVFVDNVRSVYPMFLMLLISVATTLFVTIITEQTSAWHAYRFNPTLSPLDVSGILSVFLACLWLIVVIIIAAVDDIIKESSFGRILFNLLGLLTGCLFCYYLFYYTSLYFDGGYILLVFFAVLFLWNALKGLEKKYRCGKCGTKMASKGVCPDCGSVNE